MVFIKQRWEYDQIDIQIKKLLKKYIQFLLAHFPLVTVLKLYFKKEVIKIIACPCHWEEIEIRQKEKIVKKLRYFHCHCNVEHETFVATCQGHPTIYLLLNDML